jgi:hypothetical protein
MKLKSASAALAASILLAGVAFSPEHAAANPPGHYHAGPAFRPSPRPNFNGARKFGPGAYQLKGKQFYKGAPHKFTGAGNQQLKFTSKPGFNGNKNVFAKPGGPQFKNHNFKLISSPAVKNATFAPHNAFFKPGWGGHHFYGGYGHPFYRWYGPVFWPYFWGDYFSFAFWPYDYYDGYWGYGPDVIVWGAFYPQGEFVYDEPYAESSVNEGEIYRPYKRPTQATPEQQATPSKAKTEAVAQTCAGFAPGVSDLPIAQLEKTINATEEQRAALDELKAATIRASEILKASCSSDTPLTPVSRLDAMQRRLQAMADANEAVKGPLTHLYSLLTEQQKQRLAAFASKGKDKQQPAPKKSINIAELCTSQAGFTKVPAEQISSSIELNDAQKAELEKLKDASAQASETLKASCPASVPETVDGRLDAAQQRVTALIQAVDTVKPAVRDFYASLTDEQKAALSIQSGQPQQSASNRG